MFWQTSNSRTEFADKRESKEEEEGNSVLWKTAFPFLNVPLGQGINDDGTAKWRTRLKLSQETSPLSICKEL
jgi:hypothetical protein